MFFYQAALQIFKHLFLLFYRIRSIQLNFCFCFQNGSASSPATSIPPSLAAKPVPPPRDHLKIEKDGRLVNRAPAPQLPARIANNNNNITATPVAVPVPVVPEPTREQLHSIRKYQVKVSIFSHLPQSEFAMSGIVKIFQKKLPSMLYYTFSTSN